MKIITTLLQQNNFLNTQAENNKYPKTNPLKFDAVAFGAMKKRQFTGLDFICVEKFKAPIEKFNTHKDFQTWAGEKFKTLFMKDYGGKTKRGRIHRKVILRDWYKYLTEKDNDIPNSQKSLIMFGITKDLKENSDLLPPIFKKEVLIKTLEDVKDTDADISKIYYKNLRNSTLSGLGINSNTTKWVILPSQKHDSKNFALNVARLKILSQNSWCTKTYKAEPYLANGDIHIYLDKGVTKIGICFEDNTIKEIQGRKNDWKIPEEYAENVLEHIKGYKLSDKAKTEIETK